MVNNAVLVCLYNYVTQKNADDSSTTTSTSSVSCSPRWIVHHNMGANGAWQHSTAKTQQQCLDACVANSSCVASEWSDHWKCWMHDRHRQRIPRADLVTQFEIVRQCNSKSST